MRPKVKRKEARYSRGRDEGERTSSQNPDSPHLLGQKAASAERKKKKNGNQIFTLKRIGGEEAKGEAGAGTPGSERGQT